MIYSQPARHATIAICVPICLALLCGASVNAADRGALQFDSIPHGQFRFEKFIGSRISANETNWLMCAPQANPGMIDMFHQRDREPKPNLVPWAGEFAGKYLISAVQALRLSGRSELKAQVNRLVADLIASQADDGYLGPFPKADRLKGNWDLWGHYHCMLALLMWHEATGDDAALKCCRRAADLMCKQYLGTDRRVFDAGSHEMNMAVIHGLGWLYRVTRETRYVELMREIEKDWERAGDYLRTGVAGLEFFRTPLPRWESLHDLQGLVELYRITGEERYKAAFLSHWRSILRWDRRNTGGFSSGEQATGNPYANTPIETCCTIAWMALTQDYLKLTGDSIAADELELATLNAAAGAQHPSGRWWTYNTPMDGTREASAHTIVFQARAGTPELNCCSVNGPRGLGMLSEWAVMTAAGGLVVNSYFPGTFQARAIDNTPVALRWRGDYPAGSRVELRVEPLAPKEFSLRLRIPRWSTHTVVRVNGVAVKNAQPGSYLELRRLWQQGDRLNIEFDLGLRAVPGANEMLGKVSVYRGPVLLAYDQRFNPFDEAAIPPLDLRRFDSPRDALVTGEGRTRAAQFQPMIVMDIPGANDASVRLCDFASAGALGTRYRSWLAAAECPPAPAVTKTPRDNASIPAGKALFRWRPGSPAADLEYELVIARTPGFSNPAVELRGIKGRQHILTDEQSKVLVPGQWYYWKVIAHGSYGATASPGSPMRFQVDPTLPPLAENGSGSEVLLKAGLHGNLAPEAGTLVGSPAFETVAGPGGTASAAIGLDGKTKLIYRIGEFPEEDFSVSLWVRLAELPENRVAQIFSAWASGMDDPIRLCIERGKLFARIEARQGYSTSGVAVEKERWHHLAAVKSGGKLDLFVDGQPAGSTAAPLFQTTRSTDVAFGGNPHFEGNEFLRAHFARVAVYGRALKPDELAQLAKW